jgi:hypothetical protein
MIRGLDGRACKFSKNEISEKFTQTVSWETWKENTNYEEPSLDGHRIIKYAIIRVFGRCCFLLALGGTELRAFVERAMQVFIPKRVGTR